jgi:hypothetical protein
MLCVLKGNPCDGDDCLPELAGKDVESRRGLFPVFLTGRKTKEREKQMSTKTFAIEILRSLVHRPSDGNKPFESGD